LRYEVITICPLHPHSIVLVPVEAKTPKEAVENVIGKTAVCKILPYHGFTVKEEHIVGWQPVEEPFFAEELPKYVPPPPSEKIYYAEPTVSMERLRKRKWWER